MGTINLFFRCLIAAVLLAVCPAKAFSQVRVAVKSPAPLDSSKKPFTKHYRSAGGKEFKNLAEQDQKEKAEMTQKMEVLLAKVKEEAAKIPPLEFPQDSAPLLLDCMNSSSDVKRVPGLGNKEALEFDMLVMQKKEIPSDTETIFGASALVVGFDDKAPNPSWIVAEDFGIECLPFRVRVFGDRIERYSGMDALKNFDLAKKGKFHEYVLSKYGKKTAKK